MDDLSKMLEDILSTDEGKKGLSQAMELLSGGTNKDDTQNKNNESDNNEKDSNPFEGRDFTLDPKMLLQLQSMFSSMPKNDKNSDFLRALKPLLKPERQKKADEAIKMMKLFSILPALSSSGLLKNLF